MPDLGKAVYTLILNTSQFDAGLADAERRAAKATTSIAGNVERTEVAIASMGPTTQVAAREVGAATGQMAFDFEAVETAAAETAAGVSAATGQMAASTSAAAKATDAATTKQGSAWARASGAIGGIGKSLEGNRAKMKSFGRDMRMKVTLPVIAAGGIAAKMAYDFNNSFTNIGALVGASTKDIAYYKEEVKALSGETAKAPKELADALYFVTSAGFSGASAIRVLTATAKASAAGLGDMSIVADAVTSAVNAYGEKALSAQKSTDILLATVREGKAEPAELAGSIGRVIPIAEAMGVSFDQVGGHLASMTLSGLDAAEATTALRGVMLSFLKPSKQAEEALGKYGMSAKSLRKEIREKGLFKVLMKLRTTLSETDRAAVFDNVRALAGFLNITGANAEKNRKIIAKLGKTFGDTDKALKTVQETKEFKIRKAINDLRLSMIDLGQVILPIMAKIAEKVSEWINAFNKLSPTQKKVIGGLVLVAAAIGPILGVISAMIPAIGALATAFAFLATPLGAVVLAIGALAAAVLAAQYAPRQLQAFLQKLGMTAEEAAGAVKVLQTVFKVAAAYFKIMVGVIKNNVVTTFKILLGTIRLIVAVFRGDWSEAWKQAKAVVVAAFDGIVGYIKAIFNGLWREMRAAALKAALAIIEPFTHLKWGGGWARDLKRGWKKDLRDMALDAGSAGLTSGGKFKEGWKKKFEEMVKDDPFKAMEVAAAASGTRQGEIMAQAINDSLGKNVMNPFDRPLDTQIQKTAKWDGKQWVNPKTGKPIPKSEQERANQEFSANAGPHRGVTKRTGMQIRYNVPKPKPKKPPTPNLNLDGDGGGGGGGGGGDTDSKVKELLPRGLRAEQVDAAGTERLSDDLKVQNKIVRFLKKQVAQTKKGTEKYIELKGALNDAIAQQKQILTDMGKIGVPTEIPKELQLAQVKAEGTVMNKKDDLKVQMKIRAFWMNILKNRKMTLDQQIAVRRELNSINQQITDTIDALVDQSYLRPKTKKKLKKAQQTEDTVKDDVQVLKTEKKWLNSLLKNRKLTLAQRKTILAKIKKINEELKNLMQDMKDELKDGANDATEAAKLAFQMFQERSSFFSSFGPNTFTEQQGAGGTTRVPGSAPSGAAAAAPQTPSPSFSEGGIVPGDSSSTRDTVAARLAPGEAVLNKPQLKALRDIFAQKGKAQRDVQPKQARTVKVENHQHFMRPTPDRMREARYAMIATKAAFDQGDF